MQLDVSLNDSKNNIYLEFKENPALQLINHLTNFSGFKPTSNPKRWWAKNHLTYLKFAYELQNAIDSNEPFKQILLSPSYEASYKQLEDKKFSFVAYKVLLENKEREINYVIFDDFGKASQLIAERFGKQKFGDSLLKITTRPKSRIKDSRILLEKGLVIDSNSFNENGPKSENLKTSLKENRKTESPDLKKGSEKQKHDSLKNRKKDPVQEFDESIPKAIYQNLKKFIPHFEGHLTFLTRNGSSDFKDDSSDRIDSLMYDYIGEGLDNQHLIQLIDSTYLDGETVDQKRFEVTISTTLKTAELFSVFVPKGERKLYDRFDHNHKKNKQFYHYQLTEWLEQSLSKGYLIDMGDPFEEDQTTSQSLKPSVPTMKLIQLTEKYQLFSQKPHFSKEGTFDNWQEADAYLNQLRSVGNSQVWYSVTFTDPEQVEVKGDFKISSYKDQNFQEFIYSQHLKNLTESKQKDTIPESNDPKALTEGSKENILSIDNYTQLVSEFIDYAQGKNINDTPEPFLDWLTENYPNSDGLVKGALVKKYADQLKELVNSKKVLSKKNRSIHQTTFNKLNKLIPDLKENLDKGHSHGISSFKTETNPNPAFMDLNLDVLYTDQEGRFTIALSHYYLQNGDSMADPDMEIRVDFELETVEALTFQQDSRGTYQQVYSIENGKTFVDTKLKNQLNRFLNQWLTNLIDQGHQIKWSELDEQDSENDTSSENEVASTTSTLPEDYRNRISVKEIKIRLINNDQKGEWKEFDSWESANEYYKEIRAEKEQDYAEYKVTWNDGETDEHSLILFLFHYTTLGEYILGRHLAILYAYDELFRPSEQLIHSKNLISHYSFGPLADKNLIEKFNKEITAKSTLNEIIVDFAIWTEEVIKLNKNTAIDFSPENRPPFLVSWFNKNYKNSSFSMKDIWEGYLAKFHPIVLAEEDKGRNSNKLSQEKLSEENQKEKASKASHLRNENGVYTKELAQERYEELQIPIPKKAGFDFVLSVVKDEQDKFRSSVNLSKNFGDHSSRSSPISSTSPQFNTKKEAIAHQLPEVEGYLKKQLNDSDSIFVNQEKKNKRVALAIEAYEQFIEENGFGEPTELHADGKNDTREATKQKLNKTKKDDRLTQLIQDFKKDGRVTFSSLDDQHFFKLAEYLTEQNIDYGETSRTGNDQVIYDTNKWNSRLHSLTKTRKEKTNSSDEENKPSYQNYLQQVIAEMHDNYSRGIRLSKGKIQKLGEKLEIPTPGMLWEMVEVSWLLWYKRLNQEQLPFQNRLAKMIQFWEEVQPTYNYSDSGKEQYKQYSTPCPIGAIIGHYASVHKASNTLDPSAGNGLLVMGANPAFTDVNEIDHSRVESLKFQGFRNITSLNASQPFPEEWTNKYDVVFTNPPFVSWPDEKFDKKLFVKKYFNNYRGLSSNMRMEHAMCGFALHTMKDDGKACLLIMGHIDYDKNGLFRRYRSFFNWLYAHYHVDDVINLNGFNLYFKQGTVVQTMLILVNGRKPVPFGVAPLKDEAPQLEGMEDSFMDLYERVNSHRRKDLQLIKKQLKTALKK